MYLNAHTCNLAFRNPRMREALRKSDLVYCDGAGVQLGAYLLGFGPLERMTAADFMADVACECARRRVSVFLLGGRPGIAEAAASRLKELASGLRIAGTHHGYFLCPRDCSKEVVGRINRARPDILFVGLGSPLQEIWTSEHRRAIDVPTVWCVGAMMDFVSGSSRRAPRWMRCCGLEWLWRLALEPRRLFVRYVLGNPVFLMRVLAHRVGIERNSRPLGGARTLKEHRHCEHSGER